MIDLYCWPSSNGWKVSIMPAIVGREGSDESASVFESGEGA